MSLPHGFVYLDEIDSSIILDIKYFTDDNFIGQPIKGYEAPLCILSLEAALALSSLQQKLLSQNLSFKVFDGYRPQMAVDHFVEWSKASDQKNKRDFYPNISKTEFFTLGYVAEKSAHTRGSAVDLTIVQLPANKNSQAIELPMGTQFDFMDELSHPLNPALPEEVRNNRLFLRTLMKEGGFEPYDKEWWHFTFKPEPFPNTYFNFPVA